MNACYISADRVTASLNQLARCLQTRRCQMRRKSTEIREAWNESEEIRRVSRRIMKANDLFGGEFVNRSDFFEVGAKLAPITDRNFAQTRFGEFYAAKAGKVGLQRGFHVCMG